MGRECDAGSFYGCGQLGLVYEMEGQDLARALALETRACNGGDGTGCVGVGRLYRDGKGVGKDPARAKEYFARSCGEGTGVGIGCGELGKLYDLGLGVAKDEVTAFHYMELGCKMPMAIDTCLGATDFSEQGRGTTRDLSRALHFLVLGCQGGNAATCARLARVMSHKNPPDPRATRNMYTRACDLGDAPSCEALKTLP
jgi:TPR repeat protein